MKCGKHPAVQPLPFLWGDGSWLLMGTSQAQGWLGHWSLFVREELKVAVPLASPGQESSTPLLPPLPPAIQHLPPPCLRNCSRQVAPCWGRPPPRLPKDRTILTARTAAELSKVYESNYVGYEITVVWQHRIVQSRSPWVEATSPSHPPVFV